MKEKIGTERKVEKKKREGSKGERSGRGGSEERGMWDRIKDM